MGGPAHNGDSHRGGGHDLASASGGGGRDEQPARHAHHRRLAGPRLARPPSCHPPTHDVILGASPFTDDRLDDLRSSRSLEFTRFQSWQLYTEALHEDGATLRDLRAALHGEATRYRPDLLVPPADLEDRLAWEVERTHTLRLSGILGQVARYGRQLPETIYTNDIYNLAYSVPWRPERSRNEDDARALEALRERVRQAGTSRETGTALAERVRYDAMAEAVVLVLGTYDQPTTHRFGSRRGDKKERIDPARLLWYDRWLWFEQSVRRATLAVLLERPYPTPYGVGSATSRAFTLQTTPDELWDAGDTVAEVAGTTPDRSFVQLMLDIDDERLRAVVETLNARERAVITATAAGYSTRETAALLGESGVWVGATPGAIDTCRHRLRAKARRALGEPDPGDNLHGPGGSRE